MMDMTLDVNAVAAAMYRKHKPTNPNWNNFGKAEGEIEKFLQNLNPEAKKDRRHWLKMYEGSAMSQGPYPVLVKGHGWMKVWVHTVHYQACYISRGDLNLDVQVFRMVYDKDGDIKKRIAVRNEDTKVPCVLMQEKYDAKSGHFIVCFEKQDVMLTVKTVKSMIRTEAGTWPKYDEWFHQQVVRAENDRQKSSRSKRRVSFAGGRKKKTKVSTGPTVRSFTKLDKAMEAQEQLNKELQKRLWTRKKLQHDDAFLKCLQKNPTKIADHMFEVLSQEDLVAVAKKLAQRCAQDTLEEVLHSYRSAAQEKNRSLFNEKYEEVIALNAELKKLRAQVGIGNDIDKEDDVIGTEATGPKDDADNAPKEHPDNESKEDAEANDAEAKDAKTNNVKEDAGIMRTPYQQQFGSLPHWIRSPRSSSGFKGVVKDKRRGGWRAKVGGNTIGRYASVGQAAEAYYKYCKKEPLI